MAPFVFGPEPLLRLGRKAATLGAGGGYNPVSALGVDLLGYFEARRLDSMTQAGGLVAEWRCLVTGYAVSQSTDGAKPVYSATSFGGDPGLTFDAIDDVLLNTNHPYPTGSAVGELWLLASQDSPAEDATQRYAVAIGEGAAYQRTISRVISSGRRARSQIGNGTTGVGNTNASTGFASRHVVRQILTASEVVTVVDGIATTPNAVVGDVRNSRFRFGAFINTLPGNFYGGQIAACLITNPLSGTRLTELEAWLLARRRI